MASTAATFACLTNANVRLPVPQPTSRTRSPAAKPAKSINSGASLRLQRPIKESYLSAPRETNFELIVAQEPQPLRQRINRFDALEADSDFANVSVGSQAE